MIKGWIERDHRCPILTDPAVRRRRPGPPARRRGRPGAPAAPEPVGHRLFPAMDRAVHRRPGWSPRSSPWPRDRIAYYECGNGENPRGWHTGAGMLSWWGADFGRRPVHRRLLADRRPVPAARHDRLHQAARRQGGRRVGRAQAGRELGGRRHRRRVRRDRAAPEGARLDPDGPRSPGSASPTPSSASAPGSPPRRRGRRDGRRQPQPGARRGDARRFTLVDGGSARPLGPPRRPRRLGLPGRRARCTPCARTAPAPGPTSTPPAPPSARTRRWQTLWLDHGTDPADARTPIS